MVAREVDFNDIGLERTEAKPGQQESRVVDTARGLSPGNCHVIKPPIKLLHLQCFELSAKLPDQGQNLLTAAQSIASLFAGIKGRFRLFWAQGTKQEKRFLASAVEERLPSA